MVRKLNESTNTWYSPEEIMKTLHRILEYKNVLYDLDEMDAMTYSEELKKISGCLGEISDILHDMFETVR